MSINGTGNGRDDEQTDPGVERKKFPRLLEDDASTEDMVKAINGLAVELQLNREALQEVGKAVGALEAAVRETRTR
jgi:hypothetical protein